jgi:hypothetical protein
MSNIIEGCQQLQLINGVGFQQSERQSGTTNNGTIPTME